MTERETTSKEAIFAIEDAWAQVAEEEDLDREDLDPDSGRERVLELVEDRLWESFDESRRKEAFRHWLAMLADGSM